MSWETEFKLMTVGMLAFVIGAPAGIWWLIHRDNFTDHLGRRCNDEYDIAWVVEDKACYEKCVVSASMSKYPIENTNFCVRRLCNAVPECR